MPTKILYLLRHAKAEGARPHEADSARPLAERGLKQAKALGEKLAKEKRVPAKILCSPALRTRQTWEQMSAELSPKPLVEYVDTLYMAAPETALTLIQEQDDAFASLMVVAHNPTLHRLAVMLAEKGDDALIDNLTMHYPPCTLAEIHFEAASWQEVEGEGCLKSLILPII